MLPRLTKLITGFIGLFLFSGFIIGLAYSISTGFAGVLGGLPFSIIVTAVLAMAAYDFWDECLRKDKE
jgi:hypothetical protein